MNVHFEFFRAMNFGSLGFIVSHAMVRAFGKTGKN